MRSRLILSYEGLISRRIVTNSLVRYPSKARFSDILRPNNDTNCLHMRSVRSKIPIKVRVKYKEKIIHHDDGRIAPPRRVPICFSLQAELAGTDAAREELAGMEVTNEDVSGTDESTDALAGTEAAKEELAGADSAKDELAGTDAAKEELAGTDSAKDELAGTDAAELAWTDEEIEKLAGTEESTE